jgi:hypothetical protein
LLFLSSRIICSRGAGVVILFAIFVINLRQLTISCLHALLLRSYGLLFPLASGQLIFLLALNRAGGGVRGGFLMETNFMLLALQLSVGPFGKCGIRYALTGKSFIILLK